MAEIPRYATELVTNDPSKTQTLLVEPMVEAHTAVVRSVAAGKGC